MNIYLAGEIHSNWRDQIIKLSQEKNLDINFTYPELSHPDSDNIGKKVLGEQPNNFYNDHASAKINSIKIHLGIQKADIVIIKFGEKYKQWNAAFDAGYATALSKKVIVIHPNEHGHPLKEIDAVAHAVVTDEIQVINILEYLLR